MVAKEILPKSASVAVCITFFNTSYGRDLSAITVTSRSARSRSAISRPMMRGRFSTSLSGWNTGVVLSRSSASEATRSPCTSSSSFDSMITTVARGLAVTMDCGISMPLLFCTSSTSVE